MLTQLSIGLLGGLGGLGLGILTRPTLLGMPIPLSIFSSTAPPDKFLQNMLFEHFAMTAGVGFLIAAVGADIAMRIARKPSAPSA